MGAVSPPLPALLVVAAFSRHEAALDWTARRVASDWGEIALASPRFRFAETGYYEPTMGPELIKCFWACREPIDQGRLAELKLAAGDWEREYARQSGHAEDRPLNIDPGYLTAAKLVLASTKDHAHRIYLSQGIYGEVTLYYRQRGWRVRDWTFPDYRRADYQAFFSECRDYLKRQVREAAGPAESGG